MKLTQKQLRSLVESTIKEAPSGRGPLGAPLSKKGFVYLVIGQSDTGSGSLTWPEDFDVVGVFYDKNAAEAHALQLLAPWINGGVDKNDIDADEKEYEDGSYYYEVMQLPVLG